ncbi:MAG: hypothetical protein B6I36_02340 [Desulfobacteraceae bacterium 4572_35.1]|nr:MAG: hypothetical protein B6I36_02340 [Desulfobacteraceae bacterium 4572_35.1]
MKLRCPVCHSSNSLEAYAADEAGRELLVALAGNTQMFKPLVHYLGLFRASSRDLANARALKLVNEVLTIPADPQHLATALNETVEAMRAKQQQGDHRPLKNHNYLKRVLETVVITPTVAVAIATDQPQAPKGKRAQAIHLLGQWAGDNWLRQEIGRGLATFIGVGRQGAPAVDTVIVTAGLWEDFLIGKKVTILEVDQSRIQAGFKELLNNFEKWPEPKDLFARLPRRPERKKVEAGLSDDDRAKGKAFFKGLQK